VVCKTIVGRGDFQNIVEVWFSILYWKDEVVLRFSCFGRTSLSLDSFSLEGQGCPHIW
jgi:hypothetical protein